MTSAENQKISEILRNTFIGYLEFFNVISTLDGMVKRFNREFDSQAIEDYTRDLSTLFSEYNTKIKIINRDYVMKILDILKVLICPSTKEIFGQCLESDISSENSQMKELYNTLRSGVPLSTELALAGKAKRLMNSIIPTDSTNTMHQASYCQKNITNKNVIEKFTPLLETTYIRDLFGLVSPPSRIEGENVRTFYPPGGRRNDIVVGTPSKMYFYRLC